MTGGRGREAAARLKRERAHRESYAVDAVEKEIRRSRSRERRRRNRRDRLVVLLLAVAAAAVASLQFFTVIVVGGNGMHPALEAGDVVVCLREGSPLSPGSVRRGELLVLDREDAMIVRRVAAVSGDTVDIDEGGLLSVNGEPQTGGCGGSDRTYPLTVPEGEVYVLGDYRSFAIDSRSRGFGNVPIGEAAGRPRLIVWPVYRIGMLKDAAG